MIRVDVESIIMATAPAPSVVILRERAQDSENIAPQRALSIPTGPYEAASISRALDGSDEDRPLTHALLASVVSQLGSKVERVEVSKVEPPIFYATVTLASPQGGTVAVDARPTDALALAVRVNAPIFVEDDVMNRTGRVPASQKDSGESKELEQFDRFVQSLSPDDF